MSSKSLWIKRFPSLPFSFIYQLKDNSGYFTFRILAFAECTLTVLFPSPLVAGSGCFIVLWFVPVARLQWSHVLSCLLIFFYVSELLGLFIYCRLQNEDTLVPSFVFLYWDIFIKRCFPSLSIWCLRVTALWESYISTHGSVAQLTCPWPLGPFAVTSSLQ